MLESTRSVGAKTALQRPAAENTTTTTAGTNRRESPLLSLERNRHSGRYPLTGAALALRDSGTSAATAVYDVSVVAFSVHGILFSNNLNAFMYLDFVRYHIG